MAKTQIPAPSSKAAPASKAAPSSKVLDAELDAALESIGLADAERGKAIQTIAFHLPRKLGELPIGKDGEDARGQLYRGMEARIIRSNLSAGLGVDLTYAQALTIRETSDKARKSKLLEFVPSLASSLPNSINLDKLILRACSNGRTQLTLARAMVGDHGINPDGTYKEAPKPKIQSDKPAQGKGAKHAEPKTDVTPQAVIDDTGKVLELPQSDLASLLFKTDNTSFISIVARVAKDRFATKGQEMAARHFYEAIDAARRMYEFEASQK